MGKAETLSPAWLGAATEDRFAEAFAHSVLITAAQASKVLGVDEKTFGALVDGGAVRPVLIGQKTRRYTEADLRAFLSHQTEIAPCKPQPRANVTAPRRSDKVVGFMEQKAKRDASKRRPARSS